MKSKSPFILLLSFSLMLACSTMQKLPSGTVTANTERPVSDSTFLHITPRDLSEDMSQILSTKNDELLMLIYAYQDSATLAEPLFQGQWIADKVDQAYTQFLTTSDSVFNNRLLFLLVEQDFDRPVEQIDPVVRVQLSWQILVMIFTQEGRCP